MELDKDDLHPQTRRDKYCEDHDMIKIQNALSHFVCPFCASNVEVDNDE